jgi:hypothetical protein
MCFLIWRSWTGGGTGGGATLESLMERIGFRSKPKIADLTSNRKLADKARSTFPASCHSSSVEADALRAFVGLNIVC